ncbi:hypothetical protein [Streptomyces lydicus]|uniref:effector-associated constant component EACC1 n=1 Tax=Streptomyces lydicus TaxID=47763 RepID=UPI0037B31F55
MRVRIEVGGDGVAAGADEAAGEAVRSLFTWLSADPGVAFEAGLSLVRRVEEPGPMGPALEAVEAVFDSAVQLASLVVAVAGWRSTRPRGARVHIERAGVRVTVDGGDAEAVARVVRALGSGDADEAAGAGGVDGAGVADEADGAGVGGGLGSVGESGEPGGAGGAGGPGRGDGGGGADGPGVAGGSVGGSG